MVSMQVLVCFLAIVWQVSCMKLPITLASLEKGILSTLFPGPDLSSFNWASGGQYVAQGSVVFKPLFFGQPLNVNASTPVNATLAVDPVRGYVVILFGTSYQYVGPLGYYYTDGSGVCYSTPNVTYAGYVAEYAQLTEYALSPIISPFASKSYFGLVHDPGFGPSFGSVAININSKNQVTSYAFQELIVTDGFNSKVVGAFTFTTFITGAQATASYGTVPSVCTETPPQSYNAEFFSTPPYDPSAVYP